MEEEQKTYKKEYKEFLESYQSGITTGESVGICIARMAQFFVESNLQYGESLVKYNKVASQIEQTTDSSSGKTISSAKAKVIVDATPEAEKLIMAKRNMENVNEIIQSCKALQRGIMAEYQHTNVM